MNINQAEFARRLDCSAMTVSRWERGLLQPSAENFIQLGNFGTQSEAWFFWERAGIQPAKMINALRASSKGRQLARPKLERAHAGATVTYVDRKSQSIGVPLLKAVAGTHGTPGDRRSSFRTIPATELVGAPSMWCPNPAYTNLLRVKGHSMEPLIHHGDIVAVDSFQTERSELDGKIIIASNEKTGLCVSRLRRYQNLDILEAENRKYKPVVLNKASGWRIMVRVLWWISSAP